MRSVPTTAVVAVLLMASAALPITAAVIGELDYRTEEEYAKEHGLSVGEVRRRYAATGVIECGKEGAVGSAQLTATNNVITTAAHVFVNPDNCDVWWSATDCKFVTKVGPKSYSSKIESVAGMGYRCPTLPTRDKDWAVLKLAKALDDIVPYRLPIGILNMATVKDVVAINGRSRDFFLVEPKSRAKRYPKSVGRCRIMDRYAVAGAMNVYLGTDCDAAPLASGGSLLSAHANPTLVAIHVRGDDTLEDLNVAINKGLRNAKPYRKGEWASYYVVLQGDFLEAVKSASGAGGEFIEHSVTYRHRDAPPWNQASRRLVQVDEETWIDNTEGTSFRKESGTSEEFTLIDEAGNARWKIDLEGRQILEKQGSSWIYLYDIVDDDLGGPGGNSQR